MALSAISRPQERHFMELNSQFQILKSRLPVFPLRDVIPSRTTPWITLSLIVANALVFLYMVGLHAHAREQFVFSYGLIPASFSWVSAVTSMFLHAGWIHVIGNLWSLWIFGDNVEDRMGHGRF